MIYDNVELKIREVFVVKKIEELLELLEKEEKLDENGKYSIGE